MTSPEEKAARAYPHRSPMVDTGYAAEERSRISLRQAFAAGYRAAIEDAARVAAQWHTEETEFGRVHESFEGWTPEEVPGYIAEAIRALGEGTQ